MTKLKAPKGLGDVDVLSWDEKSDYLLVCESKRLKPAKTVREIGDQLREYRGKEGDSLYKHLRRVDWIKTNIDRVNKEVKFNLTLNNISSLIVTNFTVPMKFQKALSEYDITFMSLDELTQASLNISN